MGLANWNWRVIHQFVADRFGISLSRSSCLNYLHRLGFAFKRPKKRLLKADETKREAFVVEYAALAHGPLQVIWDNAPAHRGEAVRELPADAGSGAEAGEPAGLQPGLQRG